mmetsp:Transcript_2587/g.8581  ORF Transcript_2587/g.8581 Transcript_2587/m.8581 type:complete len:302 (-) Transcript_2587:15-920(-)
MSRRMYMRTEREGPRSRPVTELLRAASLCGHAAVAATRNHLAPRRPGSGLPPRRGEAPALAARQGLHQLVEGRDKPVGTRLHLVSHLDAAKADEGVGAAGHVARLHVGRAIADHHHRAVTPRRLEVRHHLGLAAGARGRLGRVVAGEVAGVVKEQAVRVDVRRRDRELGRHRLDHLPEPARDEVHPLVQRDEPRDQRGDAGREQVRRRVGSEHRVQLLARRPHHVQPRRERLVERHRAAHRTRRERRDPVADAEEGGELVDALLGDDGRVHVEADRVSLLKRRLRVLDARAGRHLVGLWSS